MDYELEFNRIQVLRGEAVKKAGKAIQDGDLETAKAFQVEAQGHADTLNVLKAQIEAGVTVDAPVKSVNRIESVVADDAPVVAVKTDDSGDMSKRNSIYVTKFGDVDDAVLSVAKDVYGNDYEQKRVDQRVSFAKYLRRGSRHLNAGDANLLSNLIYTPSVIKAEILQDLTTSEIKAAKDVQQESALELGGFLVPEDWRMEVIRRMAGYTFVRSRARVVQTVRDKVEYPVLIGGNSLYTSGVRVTWVDEIPADADVAGTQFKVGSVDIPVHTVMARIDPSRNLIEDAGLNVVDFIANLFAESFALDEDQKFLTGTGAGTPRGVLGGRSGAEVIPLDGITTVALGGASTLTSDGIIDLAFGLDAQYMADAVMVANKATFKAIRKLQDANDDYLWEKGLQKGLPPMVVGQDFYMNEVLPDVAANAYPLIHGNWSGYTIVDRVGLTVERVEDTTTVGRNKIAIFGRRRTGGDVTETWKFAAGKVATS